MINLNIWNEKNKPTLQKILERNEGFKFFSNNNTISNAGDFLEHFRIFMLKDPIAVENYDTALTNTAQNTNKLEDINNLSKNFLAFFEHIFKTIAINMHDGKGLGSFFKKLFNTLNLSSNDNKTIDDHFFTANEKPTAIQKHPNHFKTFPKPFIYELKIIYDLRNLLDHAHTSNQIKYLGNKTIDLDDDDQYTPLQKTCLLAYLAIFAYYYPKLKPIIEQEKEPNFTFYLQSIQQQYAQYVKKYIVNQNPQNVIKRKLQLSKSKEQVTTTYPSLREAVVKLTHILVSGSAGVGKTTALFELANALATELLQNNNPQNLNKTLPIPVFIELAQVNTTLHQYAAQKLNLTQALLQDLINRNRLYWIIDAVNETTQPQLLKQVKTDITHLKQQHPLNYIVVSARPNDDLAFTNAFNNNELQFKELENQEIETFLQKNCPAQYEILQKQPNNSNILNTLKNSIFLLTEYTKQLINTPPTAQLPQNADQIVQHYVQNLIAREINEKMNSDFSTHKDTCLQIWYALAAEYTPNQTFTSIQAQQTIINNFQLLEYAPTHEATITLALNKAVEFNFLQKNIDPSHINTYQFTNTDIHQYLQNFLTP